MEGKKDSSTLKVGFIARAIRQGGAGRVITSLLDELQFAHRQGINLVVFTDEPSFVAKYNSFQVVVIPKVPNLLWDYILLPLYLLRFRLDTLIYTKYIIPFTHWLFTFRKIVIVYDLAYFRDSSAYKFFDTLYFKLTMKMSFSYADKIIAISKHTKKDIMDLFNVKDKKVSVMYLAADGEFKEKALESYKKTLLKYSIREPYILYCGSLSPRKNLLRVLDAFDRIKNDIPHHFYLVSGKSWHDKAVRSRIDRLSSRVTLLGYLDSLELVDLYNGADAYVYVSLYEGFGLPILEAQACGCPVITANTTSCPEAAGDGAYLVDPTSVEDIAQAIKNVLLSSDFQEELVEKGKENVRLFSWSKSADVLLDVAGNLEG